MALVPGTRIGPYEVVSAIGAGGMGEVYKAHDARLDRDVAIKALPPQFAADPERLARFEREAKLLASLNHANIAAIYGLEEVEAAKYLVLEYVAGESLAERLTRGALPIDEALAIARQICDALEAAHQKGVIHRDLKPANIMLTREGHAKVLDFGLAKALDTGAGDGGAATLTSPAMTQMGVILGTAAYMSPEQARGQAVDARTDIWAFGCLVFEMLAGRAAFDGESGVERLGAVTRLEPNWNALPPTVPPAVAVVLKRCLRKDPKLRAHHIADVQFQLDDALTITPAMLPSPATRGVRPYAGWIATAAVGIAAFAYLVLTASRTPVVLPQTRLDIATPAADPFGLAMSPDGRSVVSVAGEDHQLWLRVLASEQSMPLLGTDRASFPFWSADGRSIGFFAGGQMKRIDLASGFVRAIASAPFPRGGTWNQGNVIVFAKDAVGPLFSVSSEGGTVTEVTRLSPGQTNHRWPVFLPDGRQFLLFATGSAEARGIYLGSLSTPSIRRVSDRESGYAFLPPDHLLYARQGALWAKRLSSAYTPVGDFVPVASKVLVAPSLIGAGAFTASAGGAILYRRSSGASQLRWFSRTGGQSSAAGPADDTEVWPHAVSADGRMAFVGRTIDGNTDLWRLDTERGVFQRLTFDPSPDASLILSPDERRIVYQSSRTRDVDDMYERGVDGSGIDKLVLESTENKAPTGWSPDGRYILYQNDTPATGADLWALPLFGDRQPIEVVRTKAAEWDGSFSPDGRWVIFASDETGRFEIYAQPFPGPGAKQRISTDGGWRARWRRDGKEVFYVSPDNRLMAVPITGEGMHVEFGSPRELLRLPTQAYVPSPDGQRFLVLTGVADPPPLTLISNWRAPGH
jgi:Tol biopolymer transport system component